MDHFFTSCCFVQDIWDTVIEYCFNLISCKLSFINWIDCTWEYEKVYSKLFHKDMEKIFVIGWSM